MRNDLFQRDQAKARWCRIEDTMANEQSCNNVTGRRDEGTIALSPSNFFGLRIQNFTSQKRHSFAIVIFAFWSKNCSKEAKMLWPCQDTIVTIHFSIFTTTNPFFPVTKADIYTVHITSICSISNLAYSACIPFAVETQNKGYTLFIKPNVVDVL